MEELRVLSQEEIKNLNKRGSAKDHSLSLKERDILNKELKQKDKVIYILGSLAGLRVTEIEQCRFSWLDWVEFEDKKILAINIPNKDRNVRNKLKTFQTKNRDCRTTYIFDIEKATYIYTWFESNIDGLLISRQRIHAKVKNWNKYLLRELNNLHPHALRSTAQNIWKFEMNLDDIFIQLCFGWKDMNTMVKHYRSMNKNSGESYLIQQFNKK